MSKEEIREFTLAIVEEIIKRTEDPLLFEKDRHRELMEKREANTWIQFYCANACSPSNLNKDTINIAELADKALIEFKKRYTV